MIPRLLGLLGRYFYKSRSNFQPRPYLADRNRSRSIFDAKLRRALLILQFRENVGTPGCCSFFCLENGLFQVLIYILVRLSTYTDDLFYPETNFETLLIFIYKHYHQLVDPFIREIAEIRN